MVHEGQETCRWRAPFGPLTYWLSSVEEAIRFRMKHSGACWLHLPGKCSAYMVRSGEVVAIRGAVEGCTSTLLCSIPS